MKSAKWDKMPADSKIGPVPVTSITGKAANSTMTVEVDINAGENGTVKFGSNTFDAETGAVVTTSGSTTPSSGSSFRISTLICNCITKQ